MSMCRRFNGEPITRLIVSVPDTTVRKIDKLLMQPDDPARGCMAEWLRLAITEKLVRDLMLSRPRPDATPTIPRVRAREVTASRLLKNDKVNPPRAREAKDCNAQER